MSRTDNSIKNIASNLASQILTIVLGIVTRTVFIHTLGEQYLGVNGLFSNFMSMLSLVDLGVGTAITFKLYKPLSEKNFEQTRKYMNLFRIAYRVMGLTIMLIGLACMPFISFFIKGDTSFFNQYAVFALYLFQSVSTYLFFAYRSAILTADQKVYVSTNIAMIVHIFQYILQIALLWLMHSIYVYIGVVIFGNLMINIIVSIEVSKRYSYLNENKKELPEKEEIKDVFKDCYALSLYKINSVILKSIDNIVLSKYIGLAIVGLYSNYVLIFTHLKDFLTVLYNGILASLGNVFVAEKREKTYEICRTVNYATYIIFGIVAVGINTVMNPLIKIWLGEKFLLSDTFVIMLAIEFYLNGILKALSTFRSAMGLFQQGKYRPFLGAVINVVLSIALVGKYGITGVIFATIAANISTYFIIDGWIIFKYGFKRGVKSYYLENVVHAVVIVFSAFIVKQITKLIPSTVLVFFIGGFLSIIIPFGVMLVVYRNNEGFKSAIARLKDSVKRVIGKIKRADVK